MGVGCKREHPLALTPFFTGLDLDSDMILLIQNLPLFEPHLRKQCWKPG